MLRSIARTASRNGARTLAVATRPVNVSARHTRVAAACQGHIQSKRSYHEKDKSPLHSDSHRLPYQIVKLRVPPLSLSLSTIDITNPESQ